MDYMNKNVVWLASYPKSGNTWLRILLNNILSNSTEPTSINQINIAQLASCRELFELYTGINASDLTDSEIFNMRPRVYEKLSISSQADLFIKVHDAWQITPKGKELFPSRITKGGIYLIRNPLDISVSLAYHNSIPIKESIDRLNDNNFSLSSDRTKLPTQLRQNLFNWSYHVTSWIHNSPIDILVIRYEDMITNIHKTFSQILIYLGLEFTPEEIDKAIENSSLKNLKEQEKQIGFTEKPQNAECFFRKGEKDSWKQILNEGSVKSITSTHYRLMDKFGYLPEE